MGFYLPTGGHTATSSTGSSPAMSGRIIRSQVRHLFRKQARQKRVDAVVESIKESERFVMLWSFYAFDPSSNAHAISPFSLSTTLQLCKSTIRLGRLSKNPRAASQWDHRFHRAPGRVDRVFLASARVLGFRRPKPSLASRAHPQSPNSSKCRYICQNADPRPNQASTTHGEVRHRRYVNCHVSEFGLVEDFGMFLVCPLRVAGWTGRAVGRGRLPSRR